MSAATESDSLLRSSSTSRQYAASDQLNKDAARSPGPLEISRTTRFGILAGIWLGSFLSVRIFSGSNAYQLVIFFRH